MFFAFIYVGISLFPLLYCPFCNYLVIPMQWTTWLARQSFEWESAVLAHSVRCLVMLSNTFCNLYLIIIHMIITVAFSKINEQEIEDTKIRIRKFCFQEVQILFTFPNVYLWVSGLQQKLKTTTLDFSWLSMTYFVVFSMTR